MGNTMQDKKKENATEIVVDGQAYQFSVLNTEQQYLVRQMHSCSAKMNNLKFELDQLALHFKALKNDLNKASEIRLKRKWAR